MSSATKRVSSESRKGRGRLFQTRPGPATVEDRSPTLGLCDYRIQTTSTGGTNGRTITACTLICILFLRSKLKKNIVSMFSGGGITSLFPVSASTLHQQRTTSLLYSCTRLSFNFCVSFLAHNTIRSLYSALKHMVCKLLFTR